MIDVHAQKKEWNQFVTAQGGSFLQSWQWGEFQQALGRKVWRLEKADSKALIVRHELPCRQNYLYCPFGVIGNNLTHFFGRIERIARQEKSIFFKIELETDFCACPKDHSHVIPAKAGIQVIAMPSQKLDSRFRGNDNGCATSIDADDFRPSEKNIQPSKTLILDLNKTEGELLKAMHPKTRYNIRLAKRKGISVQQIADCNEQIMEEFLDLMKGTAERDSFFLHEEDYYRKIIETLGRDNMIKLFLARHNGRMIAANLVIFFGKSAVYLHGASDYTFRRFMAPYLLQWQVILEAKRLGFKHYDLFGIDEEKWPGVTRFKKGFGGEEVKYAGAYDLVFKPLWYFIYNTARKARF